MTRLRRQLGRRIVSTPSLLSILLEDRFALVDDDIEDLWALAGLGRGQVFYVHSGSGNDSYIGTDKDFSLATINAAVAKCVASRGDVIVVLPGHAETISTAALSPTLSAAGISLVGIGTGTLAPTFTITHIDGTISVTGANCRVYNIRVVANLDNVKVGLTLDATADGSIVSGCTFRDSAADKDLLVGISVIAACHDSKIIGCDFQTTAAAGSNNAILSAAVTGLEVRGNSIFGKYATGAVLTSAPLTRAIITDNIIVNSEAAIALALNGTTSTGILARNHLAGTTSVANALTGEDAMFVFENYVAGAVATSGVVNP